MGDVWERLVLNEWRTNVEAETGEEGTYSTRAFLGEFVVTAVADGKTASADIGVTRNQDEPNEVNLRLPE